VWSAPEAVARTLLRGGAAPVVDPARPDLPAWMAALEAWLPPSITTRPRRGEWRAAGPGGDGARDRVAALLVSAWLPAEAPMAARAARAWQLLVEIAAIQNRTLDDVASDLDRDPADLARTLTRSEVDAAGVERVAPAIGIASARGSDVTGARDTATAGPAVAIEPWVRALHLWGRGRFDASPSSASLITRLADLVALRALADHVDGRPERTAIDRARWHALLPAARRRALLAALRERAPALVELIDGNPFRREGSHA
jgi:hypothetical protein